MNYENKIDHAIHYMDINRYEKSNEVLFDALSSNPNDGYLLYLIGKNYFSLYDYEESLKFLKESLEKGYSKESNFGLMGTVYMGMDEYVQAEKCYLEALRLNPQNARVIAAYGLLMLKTNNQKKAIDLLDEAMRLNPNDEWVIHCWFTYYSLKNNLNRQLDTLESYMLSSNDEKDKLVKIAMYNEEKRNYKVALENLRQAYLLDPTDERLLEYLRDVEVAANPFFIPHHLIAKIGGGTTIWFTAIGLVFLLGYLGLDKIATIIAISYVVFIAYLWISKFSVEAYYKSKFS